MKKSLVFLLTVLISGVFTAPVWAGTLENLERERAIAIDSLLAPEMTVVERMNKVTISKTRLIDLERMVLRDKEIMGRNTPLVRTAFENYDLTFLVHASTEKSKNLMDHWLDEIGLSTHTLMGARVGRR